MADSDAYALMDSFNAAWNAHDLTAALALCTADVVFDDRSGARWASLLGIEQVRAAWAPVFAEPAGRFEFEEVFAAGNRVVQRWRFDWGTGHVRGVDMITLRDGRIAEKLSYVKG